MPSMEQHHITFARILDILFGEGLFDVIDRDDVADREPFPTFERQNVEQDATREERFNVVYAELLQTVCAADLLLCEAVVVPWLVPDYDSDVAEAVELRSHLADFTIKHLVVEHQLLVTKRATRRAARNRDREMALPKERNAGLKIHAQTV